MKGEMIVIKFDVLHVMPHGDNYYTIDVNFLYIENNKTQKNSTYNFSQNSQNLKFMFHLEEIDAFDFLPDEKDDVLSLINGHNYNDPSENLAITISLDDGKVENKFMVKFFSRDLDNFMDMEVRTKYPNEKNIDEIKIGLIRNICKFVEERGVTK